MSRRTKLLAVLLVAGAIFLGVIGTGATLFFTKRLVPALASRPLAPTPDELLAMEQSDDPDHQAVSAQVRFGPEELRIQRELARKEGFRLSWEELQSPAPPRAKNAAVEWVQFDQLLKKQPVPKENVAVVARIKAQELPSPSEQAVIRNVLRKRADALNLINRALRKKQCVFQRNWALGLETLFPEFTSMREATRLVRAESYLLALDGRFSEAIASQARGFQIAKHAASDPTTISYLVGLSINAITLSGFEVILAYGDDQPEVALAVQRTIATEWPYLDAKNGLRSEAAFSEWFLNRLREGGPAAVAEFGGGSEKEQADVTVGAAETMAGWFQEQPLAAREMSPEQLEIWRDYLDAAEASYLENLRHVVAIDAKRGIEQKVLVDQLDARLKQEPLNPVELFSAIQAPVLAQASQGGYRGKARQELVMAGAALLAHRARTGSFPKQLQEALPDLPQDPFTEKPLQYRREGEGFVVYSVGPTGAFDGGAPGKPLPKEESAFRYPFR